MNRQVLVLFVVLSILGIFVISVVQANNETNQINIPLPYIDQEILESFENSTWVEIMVGIRDNTGINISQSDTKEQQTAKKMAKKAIFDPIIDAILSNLTEEEFNLKVRFLSGSQFYGEITKEGFDKISNNSNIAEIYLPPPPAHASIPRAENFEEKKVTGNISENETINEKTKQFEVNKEKKESLFDKIINFLKSILPFWRNSSR